MCEWRLVRPKNRSPPLSVAHSRSNRRGCPWRPLGHTILKRKVFLVDDSPDLLSALTDLLQQTGRFEVVGSASSEPEALAWLFANEQQWDLAVVDLLLQSGSGFQILRHCQKYHPGQVIVLSEFVSPSVAATCTKFGAVAAFPKSRMTEFLEFVGSLPARP